MNIDTDKPQLPEMKGKERMEPPTSSDKLYVKSHGSNQSSARKALVPSEAIAAERLGEGAREEAGRRCRMTNEPGGRPDEAKRQPKQMRSQAESNRDSIRSRRSLFLTLSLSFPSTPHAREGRGEVSLSSGRRTSKAEKNSRGAEEGTCGKGDHTMVVVVLCSTRY